MKGQRGSIVLLAIGAAVLAAVGFSGGWAVNGWRLSGNIAELEAANKDCARKVGEANAAMDELAKLIAERHKKAQEAIAAAEKKAQAHQRAAREALSRPPAPAGRECQALTSEALDYAKRRKAGQ